MHHASQLYAKTINPNRVLLRSIPINTHATSIGWHKSSLTQFHWESVFYSIKCGFGSLIFANISFHWKDRLGIPQFVYRSLCNERVQLARTSYAFSYTSVVISNETSKHRLRHTGSYSTIWHNAETYRTSDGIILKWLKWYKGIWKLIPKTSFVYVYNTAWQNVFVL